MDTSPRYSYVSDPEAAGRAIRAQRERLGLTQRQIALRARCGLNAVSNLEAGFWPTTNRSRSVPAILAVYRQMTLRTLLGPQRSPRQKQVQAFKVAYGDVRDAWDDYLARHNRGRGVVLIGHSQGTFMLTQLIRERIDRHPAVRRRVISALLLGGDILVRRGSDRGGDFQNLPACRAAAQLGCTIAFATFSEDPPDDSLFGRVPSSDLFGQGRPYGPRYQVLCTNPASLDANTRRPLTTLFPTKPLPPPFGLWAAAIWGGTPPSASTTWVQPRDHYTGRCETRNGARVLFVEPIGDARRLKPQPDRTVGLHLLDANIALGELVDVVGRQAGAYRARQAGTGPGRARRAAMTS